MGRKKIEMKKIETINQRFVTFSKRRKGLFKKAEELSVLCGAKIAILTTSPGQRPKLYSCGFPSADDVIEAYLTDSKRLYQESNEVEKQKEKENCEREDIETFSSLEEMEAYVDALGKFRDIVMARLNSLLCADVGVFTSASTTTADDDMKMEGRGDFMPAGSCSFSFN